MEPIAQPTEPQAILTPITEAAIFLTLTVDPGAEDAVRDLLSDASGLKRSVEREFIPVTGVTKARVARGDAPGTWTYLELPSWHVPMANMPKRVSEVPLGM